MLLPPKPARGAMIRKARRSISGPDATTRPEEVERRSPPSRMAARQAQTATVSVCGVGRGSRRAAGAEAEQFVLRHSEAAPRWTLSLSTAEGPYLGQVPHPGIVAIEAEGFTSPPSGTHTPRPRLRPAISRRGLEAVRPGRQRPGWAERMWHAGKGPGRSRVKD